MDVTRQEAARLLLAAEDVLILCHRNPDGDTTGSAHALRLALRSLGKRARVQCSDPFPNRYSFLWQEVEAEDFEPKFIVSADIADEGLFGEGLAPWLGKVDLAIDHHVSHRPFAAHLLLEPDSASCCEVVCLLLREMGVDIDGKIALCLYTGMASDTGCFKFSNTTPRSHRLAADMMEAGAPCAEINKRVFETKSAGEFAAEREALNSMEIHFDGQAALIVLSAEMYERCGVTEADLGGIASLPARLEGVEVGVTIKERGPNSYKISMRSVKWVNVSDLCRQFGGGGHMFAAGCSLDGSLDEVKRTILSAVGAALARWPASR